MDRELDAAVADLIHMAVDRRERHAEMPRIGLAQLRDIVGNRSLFIVVKRRMLVCEKLLQRRLD